MRRKSPTNSRPASSDDILGGYCAGRYYDELLRYFPTYGDGLARVPWQLKPMSMHGTDACEAHHLFGGRMGRWDRAWNLAMVCRPVHEWAERYKTDGRVLGLRLKLDQGLFDADDAFKCLGFHPLGWACGVTCEFDWCERIRLSITRSGESA